jgi:hypothetical protein
LDRKRQVPSTSTSTATPAATAAASVIPSSFNISAVKEAVGQALGDLTDGRKFFTNLLFGRVVTPCVASPSLFACHILVYPSMSQEMKGP